jgi:hypothetical protein
MPTLQHETDLSSLDDSIREFILTEETFLKRMRVVKQNQEIIAENLSPAEIIQVFGNLDGIIAISQKLIDHSLVKFNGDICLAFLSLSRGIQKTFLDYCAQHEESIEIVQRVIKGNNKLEYLRKQADGLDLTSLLLEPIQRIARYPLLFKQIAQRISNDQTALKAQKEAERILFHVNEGIRSEEHSREIEHTNNRLENLTEFDLDLTHPCRNGLPRKLLRKGFVKTIHNRREIELLLFSDLLLITESNRLKQEPIQVGQLVAIQNSNRKNVLELVTSQNTVIILESDDSQNWVKDINKASDCYIPINPNKRSTAYLPVTPIYETQLSLMHVSFTSQSQKGEFYYFASLRTGFFESEKKSIPTWSYEQFQVSLGVVSQLKEQLVIEFFRCRKYEPDTKLSSFSISLDKAGDFYKIDDKVAGIALKLLFLL